MEKRPAGLTVATRQKTGKNKSTGELLVLPSRQRTTGPRAHALTKLLCLPADPSMVHRPRTPGKGHTPRTENRPVDDPRLKLTEKDAQRWKQPAYPPRVPSLRRLKHSPQGRSTARTTS